MDCDLTLRSVYWKARQYSQSKKLHSFTKKVQEFGDRQFQPVCSLKKRVDEESVSYNNEQLGIASPVIYDEQDLTVTAGRNALRRDTFFSGQNPRLSRFSNLPMQINGPTDRRLRCTSVSEKNGNDRQQSSWLTCKQLLQTIDLRFQTVGLTL